MRTDPESIAKQHQIEYFEAKEHRQPLRKIRESIPEGRFWSGALFYYQQQYQSYVPNQS